MNEDDSSSLSSSSSLKIRRSARINSIILDNVNKQLREQVEYLKTLPNPPQRSDEWFKLRSNKLTASMIAPILNIGKYGSRREVIGDKSGCLKRSFEGNVFTHWGTDFEDEAVKIYQKLFDTNVNEYSVIGHPEHSFLGASPDGITDEGTMLEIKCPPRRAITGDVPDYYACQIQLQLECCDLEVCDFLECQFSKYPTRKAFLSDNDFRIKMNGFSDNDNDFRNIHCDDYLDDTGYTIFKGTRIKSQYEVNCDLESGIDQDDIDNVVYWKLERISCVQVARNRDWFAKALPELEKAWEEISYFRQHPEEFEKKYPGRPLRSKGVYNLDSGESYSQDEMDIKKVKEIVDLMD